MSNVSSSEKNFMAILESCMPEFERYLGDFNDAYATLSGEISSCKAQAKTASDAIKESFNKLRKAIDEREALLLSQVDAEAAKYVEETNILSEAKEIFDSKPVEKARSTLANWEKVGTVGSVRAVLAAEGDVKKLKEFKGLSSKHKEETILLFNSENVDERISESIKSFGKFTVTKTERRPHNFTLHHVGAYSAVVSWDKNNTFVKYCVLRRKKSEKEFEKEPVWEGVKSSCILYRLNPNCEYDFCVKGLCGDVWSAESNYVHVVTPDLTMKELTDLKKKVENKPTCLKAFRYIIGHTTGKRDLEIMIYF